ncbi:MAG: Rne/Rng family ribonuclease [Magnetococcales bacterium]|nr:Rne/Rng family ribonuclease [Magnetococcales bacterium]
MTKRMLVDASQPEEIRIAVVQDQELMDLEIESAARAQIKGNIYVGRVVRVEPSLQAAFIDFNGGRQGFLSVNDIHPKYYPEESAEESRNQRSRGGRRGGKRRGRRDEKQPSGEQNLQSEQTAETSQAIGDASVDNTAVASSDAPVDSTPPDAGNIQEDRAAPKTPDHDDTPVDTLTEGTIETAPGLFTLTDSSEKSSAPVQEAAQPKSSPEVTAESSETPQIEPESTPDLTSEIAEPQPETESPTEAAEPQAVVESIPEITPGLYTLAPEPKDDTAGEAHQEDDDDPSSTPKAQAADRPTTDASLELSPEGEPQKSTLPEDSTDPLLSTDDALLVATEVAEVAEPISPEATSPVAPVTEQAAPVEIPKETPSEDPASTSSTADSAETADDTKHSTASFEITEVPSDDDTIKPEAADENSADSVSETTSQAEARPSSGRGSRRRRGGRGGRKSHKNDDKNGDQNGEKDETDTDMPFSRPPPRRRHIPIQKLLHRNQTILVQVVKEPRGNKGASLTTNISLAGRYIVLLPEHPYGGGISRKISDQKQRKELKNILTSLDVPEESSMIIRTAGLGRTKREIGRDLSYLTRLWKRIEEKFSQVNQPMLIHEEGDLITRTLRDLYSTDMEEILIEGNEGYRRGKNFMRLLMPSYQKRVQPYKGARPIFSEYGAEAQIEGMHDRVISLKSGGYLVLEHTEALVSIDINSGRSTREKNVENTAFKTNLQAAEEIARQLRLRDLGGLVVVDFIDMEEKQHNLEVERCLREAMRLDRAKIQMNSISQFGLLELSRQRMKPAFSETNRQPCPRCSGLGTVRSLESATGHLFRTIREDVGLGRYRKLIYRTSPTMANHLLNQMRSALLDLEAQHDIKIIIESDPTMEVPDFRKEKLGNSGSNASRNGQKRGQQENKSKDHHRNRDNRRGGRPKDRNQKLQEPKNQPNEAQQNKPEAPKGEATSAPETEQPQQPKSSQKAQDNASNPATEGDEKSGRRKRRRRRRRRGGRGRGGDRDKSHAAQEIRPDIDQQPRLEPLSPEEIEKQQQEQFAREQRLKEIQNGEDAIEESSTEELLASAQNTSVPGLYVLTDEESNQESATASPAEEEPPPVKKPRRRRRRRRRSASSAQKSATEATNASGTAPDNSGDIAGEKIPAKASAGAETTASSETPTVAEHATSPDTSQEHGKGDTEPQRAGSTAEKAGPASSDDSDSTTLPSSDASPSKTTSQEDEQPPAKEAVPEKKRPRRRRRTRKPKSSEAEASTSTTEPKAASETPTANKTQPDTTTAEAEKSVSGSDTESASEKPEAEKKPPAKKRATTRRKAAPRTRKKAAPKAAATAKAASDTKATKAEKSESAGKEDASDVEAKTPAKPAPKRRAPRKRKTATKAKSVAKPKKEKKEKKKESSETPEEKPVKTKKRRSSTSKKTETSTDDAETAS